MSDQVFLTDDLWRQLAGKDTAYLAGGRDSVDVLEAGEVACAVSTALRYDSFSSCLASA